MTSIRLVPALALLAACAPQNASLVSGSYIAFIADATSISLQKEAIDPDKYNQGGEPCGEGAQPGDSCSYNMDCRTFENGLFASESDEEALRLEEPIKICGDNEWPPEHEEWATQAGFRVVTESLDPWRGEALVTSEGDLQIAFHHRVPGGSDMRFILAVDPDFAPTHCITDADGKVVREPYDGDWVEHWSRGTDVHPAGLAYIESLPPDDPQEPGELIEAYDHLLPYLDGRLYFLNDDSYQLNPSQTDDFWYFPDYWQAGSNIGKFVEEDIGNRSPRYADPWVYNYIDLTDGYYTPNPTVADLFYCESLVVFGGDPEQDTCMANLETRTNNITEEIREELDRMMSPTGKPEDTVFKYAPIPHVNFWRLPDGRGAGLDGWGELHYNYIVFSKDSDLSVGGAAKGAFSLVFDAYESSTRFFVKGEFEIDKIKKDRWTAMNLEEQKLIENDVELCNASSEHEADPKDVPDPAQE